MLNTSDATVLAGRGIVGNSSGKSYSGAWFFQGWLHRNLYYLASRGQGDGYDASAGGTSPMR